MSLELTAKATLLKNQTNVEQQLIVEIDGIPFIYGAVTVTKLAAYGDTIFFGDSGLVFGGITEEESGRSYITLDGTTRSINQQLEIEKGGIGSVQKFNVVFVDKNQEVTKAFSPGTHVSDILGRDANVFIGFQGGAHPEDSVRIFNGVVTAQEARPGSWKLSIDHPQFLQRQTIFQQVNTKLDGAVNDSVTSMVLEETGNLIVPQDAVRTYIKIDDEIIEYTTVDTNTNTLSGMTRARFGTIAASHDDEAEAVSFYRLQGDPIDLALKIMLSDDGNNAYKTDVSAPRFVQVDNTQQITNGILVQDRNFQANQGLELGDLISISGDPNPANNFTDAAIAAFVLIPDGTVIVVSGPSLVPSIDSPALMSLKSQWNTLPSGAGCEMKPTQVDVSQHNTMKELFPSLPPYDFYLKESIDSAKEFLTSKIYFPAGFYQSPRKGRASVAATIPPLVLDTLVELTDKNVKKAGKNSIKRQLTKEFYNSVTYKFNVDAVEDKFLAGTVEFSQRSLNRIKTGNKPLVIEAEGFRDDTNTRNYIKAQARRFSDRYQFAAESISVETNYKTGFPIEVSDVVLFGNDKLQIPDINEASRDFKPRLMEVKNKKMDIRGTVVLELLDTGFGLDGRFGTISPNSFIGSGATTTMIPLKASFATDDLELERNKWTNFLGEEIRVRSVDFTFQETVRLVQFDPSSLSKIVVDPALSVAPSEDYIIDLPDYPDSADPDDNRKMKNIHNFFTPQVEIVSGISTTEFTVNASDLSKFLVDAYVIVHNDDYSDISTVGTVDEDLQVSAIDSGLNKITLNGSMGFTPAAGYKVDLIGFKDGGLPYRLI